MVVAQLLNEFPAFMEPQYLSMCSQQPPDYLYLLPDEFIASTSTFFSSSCLIVSSDLQLGLPSSLVPSCVPTKTCMHSSFAFP